MKQQNYGHDIYSEIARLQSRNELLLTILVAVCMVSISVITVLTWFVQ